MLQFVLELIAEFVINIVIEALAEAGLHATADTTRPQPGAAMSALLHAAFGALAGGLSLLVVPAVVASASGRLFNVIVTPVVVGGMMVLMGAWRARRGEPVLRIDRFVHGYVFALSLALVRMFWGS